MSGWMIGQTIRSVGERKFEAWCEVRKRTPYSRNLTPDKCERAAHRGDPAARQIMDQLTSRLVALRLKE